MEVGAVCIPNIGPRERAKRLRFGLAGSAVGLGVTTWLLATGQPSLVRLVLFPVALGAALGIFQAREKT